MTNEEGSAPARSLDGTIWPQVDRALSGITASAERAVLDVVVSIPRDEVIRGLKALKADEAVPKKMVKLLEADAATGGLLFDLVDVVERLERVAQPRRRPGREAAGPRRHVAHRKGPRDKRSRRRK